MTGRPELAPGTPVAIEYGRLGGDTLTYRQTLVHAGEDAIVTLQRDTPIASPKRVGTDVVLEPGSPVVWFTFEGAWHDIGAFHLADGTFTGLYANMLTPVELFDPDSDGWRWRTTDLCLDVWKDGDAVRVLDEDELDTAIASGSVDAELAARARGEAARPPRAARSHESPPAAVAERPLERARSVLSAATRR